MKHTSARASLGLLSSRRSLGIAALVLVGCASSGESGAEPAGQVGPGAGPGPGNGGMGPGGPGPGGSFSVGPGGGDDGPGGAGPTASNGHGGSDAIGSGGASSGGNGTGKGGGGNGSGAGGSGAGGSGAGVPASCDGLAPLPCLSCCANAHPSGVATLVNAFVGCGCQATTCAKACKGLCDGSPTVADLTPECVGCMSDVLAGQAGAACALQVTVACFVSAECKAYVGCAAGCL
jgi:hypothetical protein